MNYKNKCMIIKLVEIKLKKMKLLSHLNSHYQASHPILLTSNWIKIMYDNLSIFENHAQISTYIYIYSCTLVYNDKHIDRQIDR